PVGFLQFIPNSSGGFFGQLLRALFSLTKSQMLVAPERISAKLRQHEHGRENEQRLPDEARLAVLSFGATFAHFEIDDNAAKRGCMSCFCKEEAEVEAVTSLMAVFTLSHTLSSTLSNGPSEADKVEDKVNQ